MTTFSDAVDNQEARTLNDMKARASTANACVDLFYKIGASRGKDITKEFTAAFVEDKELALRVLQWGRDVRGGSGERKLFRDMLLHLEKTDTEAALALVAKIPEIGRWDDLLVFETDALKTAAFESVAEGLRSKNGLCAKWMPRKGPIAVELRKYLDMTPKQYRKTLVELTNVVETQMCANHWDEINFSQMPSLAAARYKRALERHTPKYAEYVAALVKGDDPTVKVNAGAVYPYDVLKTALSQYTGWGDAPRITKTERDHMIEQWKALPNYVGENQSILPLVDVSGSMTCPVAGGSSLRCLDVAVSLGLYLADKNKGKFQDTFLTFSFDPELMKLKGNIMEKMDQMIESNWHMSTNLHRAFDKILEVAKQGNVPHEEMPKMLLILSDMQFNQCTRYDDSAIEMIRRKYEEAGYEMPQVVFWNLNSNDNVPVKHDERGVALVSGFSPAVMKSLIAGNVDEFSPEAIMMKTVMIPRYDVAI